MPDWFGALNRDFRYQLTVVGAPAPKLYIAEGIAGNRFKIAGGPPGGKVSWQVTGIRQDAYAEAYRIQVEEDKPEVERGSYLHPELYGQPEVQESEMARRMLGAIVGKALEPLNSGTGVILVLVTLQQASGGSDRAKSRRTEGSVGG